MDSSSSVARLFNKLKDESKIRFVEVVVTPQFYFSEPEIRPVPLADTIIPIGGQTERSGRTDLVLLKRRRVGLNVLTPRAKRHRLRKGREKYHERIQKKWDKRVAREGFASKLADYEPRQLMLYPHQLDAIKRLAGIG